METGRIRFRRARFQTPNSASLLGRRWVPGRELSEFLSAYGLCGKVNSPSYFCRNHQVCRRTQWVLSSEAVLSNSIPPISYFRPSTIRETDPPHIPQLKGCNLADKLQGSLLRARKSQGASTRVSPKTGVSVGERLRGNRNRGNRPERFWEENLPPRGSLRGSLLQRKRDDNKNKILRFSGGGVGREAGRKSVQNAIFHGKRHDKKILKIKILLSRNFVVMAHAPTVSEGFQRFFRGPLGKNPDNPYPLN